MSTPFELQLASLPALHLDVLWFQLDDRMSQPYTLQVWAHPHEEPAGYEGLVGTRATFAMNTAATSRVVFGVIRRVELDHMQSAVLRLLIVPQMETLALSVDSRIFQTKTSSDIALSILAEHGIEAEARLIRRYEKREYCVQYQESTLAFIERVLAADGVFYFFEHDATAGKERVILADHARAYGRRASDARLHYRPEVGQGMQDDEHAALRFWARHDLSTKRVALLEYDFTRPTVNWTGSADAREAKPNERSGSGRDERPTGQLELFDHEPPQHQGGVLNDRAGTLLSQVQRDSVCCEGTSLSRALEAGHTFQLQGHGQRALDGDYTITQIHYEGRGEPHLAAGRHRLLNSFQCVRADVVHRPPPPARVLRQVVESARVVGPPGSELHTDEHGRIKVQFHWDRDGKLDDRASCFIRVLQAWSGAGFGAQFIPRVGTEVLVTFVGGNLDEPVVLGSLFNATHLHPYPLPRRQTASGLRSNSFGGSGGYNEVRFEDSPGEEELVLHAHNRLVDQVGGDHESDVGRSRTIRVAGDSTASVGGDSTHSAGGALTLAATGRRVDTVGGEHCVQIGAAQITKVASHASLKVGGDMTESVNGSAARSVGGRYSMTVGGWHVNCGSPAETANASFLVHGAFSQGATGNITLTSEQSIDLVCGETRIRITPDGVSMTSPNITINGTTQTTVTGKDAHVLLGSDAEISAPSVSVLSSGAGVDLGSNAEVFGAQVQLKRDRGQPTTPKQEEEAPETKALDVTITNAAGKAHAGATYCLLVEGVRYMGTTTGAGGVSQQIPKGAQHATLTVWTGSYPDGPKRVYELALGGLPPASTLEGARARLENLGYAPGTGEELDAATRGALERFQSDNDLEPTAELDAATIATLSGK